MATVAAPAHDRKAAERKFYSRMAIFLVVVVFLGFAPSFYLRDVVPPYPRPNPTLPPAVIFHGLMFTLWMALLIIQTQLVSTRRTETHMKLGKAAMLVAVALIPVMYLTAVWAVPRESHPPFTDSLNWTAIPLAVIPSFAFLIYEAWRRRKQAQWHKRLMLSATILVVAGPSIQPNAACAADLLAVSRSSCWSGRWCCSRRCSCGIGALRAGSIPRHGPASPPSSRPRSFRWP